MSMHSVYGWTWRTPAGRSDGPEAHGSGRLAQLFLCLALGLAVGQLQRRPLDEAGDSPRDRACSRRGDASLPRDRTRLRSASGPALCSPPQCWACGLAAEFTRIRATLRPASRPRRSARRSASARVTSLTDKSGDSRTAFHAAFQSLHVLGRKLHLNDHPTGPLALADQLHSVRCHSFVFVPAHRRRVLPPG